MEYAIICVALFYKVGSSIIKDFSKKEKFRILVKRDITLKKKSGKLWFYLFFDKTVESTNNYITDAFQMSKKSSPSGVIFQYF